MHNLLSDETLMHRFVWHNDPKSFEQLVARYGHRMTHVGDEERILIIVNAPRGGSSNRLIGLQGQRREFTYFPLASHGDRDHVLFSFAQSELDEETSQEVLEQVVQELRY